MAVYAYFTYAALNLTAVIVLYKWMPEPKGIGLERVAEMFNPEEGNEITTLVGGRATPTAEGRRRQNIEGRKSSV